MITAFPGFKGCGATIGQCFMALPKGTYEPKAVNGLMDTAANSYLEDVLSDMGNFHAINVDGDGNCLAHAISRVSIGTEIYWHAVRSGLHQELIDHRQFYIDQFSDVFGEAVDAELDEAIREAGPSTGVADASEGLSQAQQQIVDDLVQDMGFERKKSEFVIRSLGDCEDIEMVVNQYLISDDPPEDGCVAPSIVHGAAQYMSPLHLFGIANVLRRPLILISAKSDWGNSNSGVYLPLRHSPADCAEINPVSGMPGNLRSPVTNPPIEHTARSIES